MRFAGICPVRGDRRAGRTIRAALVSAALTMAARAVAHDGGESPFADAVLAPADATIFLHVDDSAAMRRLIAGKPLARGIARVLAGGEFASAWRHLAEMSGHGDDELLDLWLGRRVTLVTRNADWALVTEVDPAAATAAIERLTPRRLAPRESLPIVELPEHALLIASRGATWVVGPAESGAVFAELLARIAADPPARGIGAGERPASLADDPLLAPGRELGPGRVAIFLRHDSFVGGASTVVVDLGADRIRVRHAARFDTPPFTRELPSAPIDMAPLQLFENRALLAVIEPADMGAAPIEIFAEVALGVPLLSQEMRRNLGDVRIVAVGEVEGRREVPPRDRLEPTAAVALRVRDARGAAAQLDAHMERLARAMADRAAKNAGATLPEVAIPDLSQLPASAPRHVVLGPGAGGGVLPEPLRPASLDWTVATCALGTFYVVATHPEHLRDTVAALEASGSVQLDPRVDRWASCGTIDGERLAVHLRAHADDVSWLGRDPAEEATFRDALLILSELSAGVDRCRWRLRRPTAEIMGLEIDLLLAPPESAAEERGR
jgi:hypothetical protein